MSAQDEDGRSLVKGSESHDDVLMKPKISYSREFLLSISSLDACKKLPSGFVESLTSELEDALLRIPDNPRIPGSLPFQGFRRNEYASSPPTRGDSGSYSRVVYGKWESRSLRSDRDSDSQSDRDSDSARRYGNHSRRSWETTEHDGLLGSGSFPRSSGYAADISASKVRANEPNQLSRSTEPYHPPRPYKAAPHSRKDTDAFNDETFGSMECTSEDRAEQERKRRASFEMMRKEQQKSLQEKQNLNLERHRAGGISNLSEVLLDGEEEKGLPGKNDEVDVSAVPPILSNDLEKSSFASHTSSSRPLIPPGFRDNTLEKCSGFKSLIHPSISEVGKPMTGESPVVAGPIVIPNANAFTNLIPKANDGLENELSQEISLVHGQPAEKTQHTLLFNKREHVSEQVSLDVPIKKPGVEDTLFLDAPGITELNGEVLKGKNVHDSNKSHSTLILEKIFGSALSTDNGHSSSAKFHDAKPDDTRSPDSVQSSKFAQWFSEDESKAVNGVSSSMKNDLLLLIVSGDKDKNQVSDSEAAKLFTHDSSYKTTKQSTQVKLNMPSAVDGLSSQASTNSKEEVVPTVLTCEDLEQSILSECSAKTTDLQPNIRSWSTTGGDTEQPSTHADDNASLDLLSMLQKSMDHSNTTVTSVNLADKQLVSRGHDMVTVANDPKGEENGNVVPNLGKTLTLEALFGTAFMQELQSVEAPVSVQRGSAQVDTPEPHGIPFPASDNGTSFPVVGKSGLPRPRHDHSISSNDTQYTKSSEAENWRIDDSQIGITSPKRHAEALNNHGGFERGTVFQLPEEDNLISVGDAKNPWMLTSMSTGNSTNMNPSSSPPINIMEKLAAFGAVVKDKRGMEGSESMPFTRDSYQQMQPSISFHNLQLQQHSSPHFQPPQMPLGSPLYHHLESDHAHMSSQMFLGPEPTINHDSPAKHPFPLNIIQRSFHQPNVMVSGFDAPSQHNMLHHLQMPGNHPLPHFARGSSVPHHGNQTTGLVREINQMQGFPLGPHQPSIVGSGVPMPGGSNSPEAFQRLIEMELRANSKQIHHPFAPTPIHGQGGIVGHEVDMAFRYR